METHRNDITIFFSVTPASAGDESTLGGNAGNQILFGKQKKDLDSRFRGNDRQERKKVMVFGVFDRLHAGHISFLEQAAQLGDELVVAVARDFIVRELKKKTPMESEDIRASRVACVKGVTHAMLGDQELGSWDVIAVYKPDIICLGYDQKWMKQDLDDRITKGLLPPIKLCIADAYEPERLHTSLLTGLHLQISQ